MLSKFPTLGELNIESHRRQSYVKKMYPEFEQYIIDNFEDAPTWSEKLYWYYHSLSRPPKCTICGGPVKFDGIIKGYRTHCSRKCNNNDPNTLVDRKQIFLERYGFEYPTRNESVKNKIKQTNLNKYGAESQFQLPSFESRRKQICLNKYGVEYASQSETTKTKAKQTCLEKYGAEYYNQSNEGRRRLIDSHMSQEYRNKIKQTNLEKYGAESLFQSDVIKNKIKQTNIEKYGVENPFQSKDIQNKIKQTNLEKYGAERLFQSDVIKNKIKQTNIEKYGVENPFQSKDIRNKIKQTNLEKYGVEHASQSEAVKNKINDTKKKNRTFNTSQVEKDFELYLTSCNVEYKTQYKSESYPFNCDFYIPKYDLYVEIQGTWLHGHHPYNQESDEKTLKMWKLKNTKFYDNAIETWTIRDVKKRSVAEQNNLNYLEIFSDDINEVITQFKDYINNVNTIY